MTAQPSGMDRERCLRTLRRMRDSLFISLLCPPSWWAAVNRAIGLIEGRP